MADWRDQRRERFERERAQRSLRKEEVRKLDIRPLTAEEIDARIDAAIDAHHEHVSTLISGVAAKVLDEGESNLRHAMRKLEAEVAKFEAEIAKLRAVFFTDKAERAEKGETEKNAPADPSRPLLNYRTQMN